jgi:flagellar biosynthetic protein FlhB
MSDRTAAPTPRRIEEAREEGRVARSLELNTAAILLAGALLLRGPGASLVLGIREFLTQSIIMLPTIELTGPWLRALVFSQALFLAPKLGLILIALLIAGVAVTLVQTGFLWAGKKIGFDFKRINPLDGLKRIFSGQGLIELGRALIKLAFVGYVAYAFLRSQAQVLMELSSMDLASGISKWVELAGNLAVRVGTMYFVLAVADYAFQRWRFMRSMRMTKEEIKEDIKRSEGDPFLRSRIRGQQRRLARNRMMSNVPKAKVIITNPTHLAIAIDYGPEQMRAPRVLAKGAFALAERIVSIAKENRIPVVQNIPVARAIYKTVEVEQEIPPDLYLAVAEILAYVYRMKKPVLLTGTAGI